MIDLFISYKFSIPYKRFYFLEDREPIIIFHFLNNHLVSGVFSSKTDFVVLRYKNVFSFSRNDNILFIYSKIGADT